MKSEVFHSESFCLLQPESHSAAYHMPTSSTGPWQKLVPISCRLSDHVTMAAVLKGAQSGPKGMILRIGIESQVLHISGFVPSVLH